MMQKMEIDDLGSMPSTPVTPEPLFEGFEADKLKRKSLLSRSSKCFNVDTWPNEERGLPTVNCSITVPPPLVPLAKKVIAEFVGTLILICAGMATAILNQKTQGSETLIGLAASSGLAVMIIILSTGHISGAHLNPSITIAFAALIKREYRIDLGVGNTRKQQMNTSKLLWPRRGRQSGR